MVKMFLGNWLIQGIFAAISLIIIFGFFGIRLVPKYFNKSQIERILSTASFVSFVIGALLLLIFLFIIEGAMTENSDFRLFNSWIMKTGLGIFFGMCSYVLIIFWC